MAITSEENPGEYKTEAGWTEEQLARMHGNCPTLFYGSMARLLNEHEKEIRMLLNWKDEPKIDHTKPFQDPGPGMVRYDGPQPKVESVLGELRLENERLAAEIEKAVAAHVKVCGECVELRNENDRLRGILVTVRQSLAETGVFPGLAGAITEALK